jgi:transmembrane sensor
MAAHPDHGEHDSVEASIMDEALRWFTRLRSDTVGDGERRDFAAWRARDPAHAAAYAQIEAMGDAPEVPAALMRDPQTAIPASSRRVRWRGRVAVALAAVLLLFVGMGAVFDLPTRLQADQQTATGEQKHLTLADGSTLVLNTASAMAIDFTPERRGVRLLGGEAYFDVTSNDRRPFEVIAGEAIVRAMGTAFAVRRGESGVYVIVARGVVTVGAPGEIASPVQLYAGDEVRVHQGHIEWHGQIDTDMALAWHDGRLVFRDQPLDRVLHDLARYHWGWIVVANDRLKGLHVSGNYRLDDPVRIIASLAKATGAQMIRLSDAFILLR